ncbi:MAG: hypothetical protein ACYC1Q_09040 [Bacteroidia bacterium]
MNKTEESVFTLFSLGILIIQAFESLTNNEDVFNVNFEPQTATFADLTNDIIREALVYQILIKTCSFMDEWNSIFGVKTEKQDEELILKLKKIAKPASHNISFWKELRDFRNHYIAHNFRDSTGRNVFLNPKIYHSPQSDEEIYLLIVSVDKMMALLNFFFPETVEESLLTISTKSKVEVESMELSEIKRRLKNIETIDHFISASNMKEHLLQIRVSNYKQKNI